MRLEQVPVAGDYVSIDISPWIAEITVNTVRIITFQHRLEDLSGGVPCPREVVCVCLCAIPEGKNEIHMNHPTSSVFAAQPNSFTTTTTTAKGIHSHS